MKRRRCVPFIVLRRPSMSWVRELLSSACQHFSYRVDPCLAYGFCLTGAIWVGVWRVGGGIEGWRVPVGGLWGWGGFHDDCLWLSGDALYRVLRTHDKTNIKNCIYPRNEWPTGICFLALKQDYYIRPPLHPLWTIPLHYRDLYQH